MAGAAPRRRDLPEPAAAGARAARSPGSRGRHASAGRFAVVAARFNEPITKRLVDGAITELAATGIPAEAVDVVWVPGSFELPQAAAHLAGTRRYAGIICVGVVIRGQTPHFEYVAREAASGIRHVALTTGIPVTFGVITALNEGQAWERAGGEIGNRGSEAAAAAHEMAELVAHLRRVGRGGARATRRTPPRGT